MNDRANVVTTSSDSNYNAKLNQQESQKLNDSATSQLLWFTSNGGLSKLRL